MKKIIVLSMVIITLFCGCNKNVAPDCDFIKPQEGQQFRINEPISVMISAHDMDGNIVEVQLFIDDVLFQSKQDATYNFSIPRKTLSAGNHRLKAVAVDNEGAKTEKTISITISDLTINPNNILPECAFISPINNYEYHPENEILVEINATDEDGNIAEVQFFIDDVLKNTMKESPYEYVIPISTFSEGSHKLSAIAIDNEWGETEASITIKIANGSESPNFVTFSNGHVPSSWILKNWHLDNTTGHDDSYSIKANIHGSPVKTTKTFDKEGYVEFYTSTPSFLFYVNGEKIPFSSLNEDYHSGEWTRWWYVAPAGTHQFQWNFDFVYVSVNLDAITFADIPLPSVNIKEMSYYSYYDYSVSARYTVDSYNQVTDCGICWSKSPDPTVEDNCEYSDSYNCEYGNVYVTLEHFEQGTYYFRAFAYNSVGIAYSDNYMLTVQ